MANETLFSDPVILEKEISAFRQAENNLVQAQVKLAHMLSSSPAVIYSFDAKGNHKPSFISDNFTAVLGYGRHEYMENPKFWEKCIHPEDIDRVMKALPRLWEEGRLTQEYRFCRKDGTYTWVNDDMKLVRDENGEPREVVGSWSDIEERKEAELSMIQARDRLDHIMSTSPSVVYSFKATEDRTPTYISRNVTNLLGYEPREYLENPNFWIERVHPDDLDRITNYLPRLFKEGRLALDYRLQKKDKSYCWINDVLVLRKDENDNPVEVIGSWSDITAKTQVGEALVSAQNRLSHLISFTPAVIYSFDVTGDNNATFVSENIKDLLGYEPKEYLDDREFWVDRLHPDDKDRILREFPNLWETGTFEQEYRFRKKDGDYLWVNDQLRVIKDENDEPKEVVGAWTDITELKQREQALAEADKQKSVLLNQFNAILDAIDYGVTFMDTEQRGMVINRAFREMWGITDEFADKCPTMAEIINYNRYNGIYDVPESEFDAYIASRIEEIKKGDTPPYDRHLADGRIIRYRIISLPDDVRMITYFDITELKQREREAKEAEIAIATAHARINHILSSSPSVLYSFEATGKNNPTFISDNVRDLFGYDPGEYLKDRNFVPDRIHPEDSSDLERGFSLLFKEGHLINEYRFRHKDGSYHWVSDELRVIYDEAGKPVEIVGSWSDIDERKEVEAALAIAKEKAEAANRAKTQFVSSISHEFRTPLNAVIGITEMLIEDARAQDNKVLDEPLTRVHRAGKHLLSLINEFLDISKIEAGKVDLHIKPFNISELIKDVAATVKPMLDSNHNTLDVKNMTKQEEMQSDSKRVMQILLNLLSNAAKFTENGSVTLKTKSSIEDNTDYILFDVIDTGTGIPEGEIDHVFDEYSQVKSSASSKYAGTGLGLGISRKLARIMGGDITVTSKYGEGSTFTAKLPVKVIGDAVQSHKIN
jgi:PAS domain S-box-containing protein